MNLVIRAVSLAGAPLSQSITGYFDTRGGTIGRSDTNTMALPDPERLISRLQAEIWHTNDSFMVRNVGTANAIMHNDHRVAPGESAALVQGDELQVGAYVLKVQ
jgi:FHA domain-containing protein